MKKYLMVCLGNICRSPIAQGLLEKHLAEAGKDGTVDSCGTGDWHAGGKPDSRSIEKMNEKGYDITAQRARQFRISDFEEFDEIFVMDRQNLSDVLALTPNLEFHSKVSLILDETHPNEVKEVPDPYYGEADGFETVYQLLDKACFKIAQRI